MTLVGYARVSSHDQNPTGQHDALIAAGVEDWRIFTDTASGKLARRPQLDRALAIVAAGDVLVVTKLDRLGRSLRHLLDLTEDLGRRGVGLRVLTQGIDTTSPAGRLFFQIVAAVGEFEAALISERTLDGLAAARARGRTGGRKPKLSTRQLAAVRRMHGTGEHTVTELAGLFSVTRPTIYRALREDEASA